MEYVLNHYLSDNYTLRSLHKGVSDVYIIKPQSLVIKCMKVKKHRKEIEILKYLSSLSNNIVEFKAASTIDSWNYIITKYDSNYISLKQFKTENKKVYQFIIQQIYNTVNFIHNHNIVHGDVKPNNILINNTILHIKFIDFGSAFYKDTHYFYDGTPEYTSPYLYRNRYDANFEEYKKADLWAIGMIIMKLLTKESFLSLYKKKIRSSEKFSQLLTNFSNDFKLKRYKNICQNITNLMPIIDLYFDFYVFLSDLK